MKKSLKNATAICLLSLSMLAAACGKKNDKNSSNTPASEDIESSVVAPVSSEAPVSSSSEAHVHAFGEWTVKTPATHTAKGVEERTCSCGEKETRDIEKTTEHEFGAWTVTTPATHTAKGFEERTCACGEKETRDIEKTSAHEYGEWTTASQETCTTAEVLERTCSCGEKETKEGKPATGHDLYSDWRMDDDYHWHSCKHDATEQIDKAEHVYDQKVISEEYLAQEAEWYHGNSYFYTCVCGAVGTTGFVDETSNPVAKELVITVTPTETERGAVKAVYTNGMESPVYPLPEFGNTNFWAVSTTEDDTSIVTTYKFQGFNLMQYIKWWNAFDTGHTPAEGAQLTNLFSTAIKQAYGDSGFTYSATQVKEVFHNGYCPATKAQKFYLYTDQAMSITGKGTVVTGKVEGASVSVGDKVAVYKNGTNETVEYTISSIEMFNKTLTKANPGDNVGIYFEENPDKSEFARGNLVADPAGNWEARSNFNGTVYLLENRSTPISSGYRPQAYAGLVDTVASITFPDVSDILHTGEMLADCNMELINSVYLPDNTEIDLREGGKKIGYFVTGSAQDNCGTYVKRITVLSKSKPSDTNTSKYVVAPEHFVDEDGNQFDDPMMLKPVATPIKNYELFVGVTGCGTITGRGTYIVCPTNGIYEKDSSGWRTSGSVEMNESYIGKMATIEFVDAEGVLTSSQHVITGTEKKSDGTYSFLMRGLESTAAENAVRMYVEA